MMLQDIAPHEYHLPMSFVPAAPENTALVCSPDGVLLRETENGLALPKVGDLPAVQKWTYAFTMDNEHFYLTQEEASLPGYTMRKDYRHTKIDQITCFACAIAQSLDRWYRANRFCGACGGPMEQSKTERAMVCPRCKRSVYPKICPAVIVAVCDGDRLLLTKYRRRVTGSVALIAGFCEIGETVEETAHREVMEETGVAIKNLRYYKTQPWVVSDTLLMGFFADLDGSDKIRLQEDELAVGEWVRREDLPLEHTQDSLTGEMIEQFRAHKER